MASQVRPRVEGQSKVSGRTHLVAPTRFPSGARESYREVLKVINGTRDIKL